MRPGLLLGFLLVWMLVFANTTCFDLAAIYTVSNELRAGGAGATPVDLLPLAWPSWLLAVVVSVLVWRRCSETELQQTVPVVRPTAWLAFGLLWCLSYLLPTVLQWLQAGALDWSTYFDLYGNGLLRALGRARVGLAGLIPLWLLVVSGPMTPCCRTAVVLSIGWIACRRSGNDAGARDRIRLEPAGRRGSARGARFRRPAATRAARTAIIPVLLARWAVRSEPEPLRSARRLEHDGGLVAALRPRLVIASVATVMLGRWPWETPWPRWSRLGRRTTSGGQSAECDALPASRHGGDDDRGAAVSDSWRRWSPAWWPVRDRRPARARAGTAAAVHGRCGSGDASKRSPYR